jgi:hypothetical protein
LEALPAFFPALLATFPFFERFPPLPASLALSFSTFLMAFLAFFASFLALATSLGFPDLAFFAAASAFLISFLAFFSALVIFCLRVSFFPFLAAPFFPPLRAAFPFFPPFLAAALAFLAAFLAFLEAFLAALPAFLDPDLLAFFAGSFGFLCCFSSGFS